MNLDLAEVVSLYDSVGWSVYTGNPRKLDQALRGSSTIVEAREGSRLVGLARVVSDGASICYLQDLLVRPSHQRQGIGRALVHEVMLAYEDVRQKVLITDDERRQKLFYESLGYSDVGEFNDSKLRAFVRFD